jgi:hypothetical protein
LLGQVLLRPFFGQAAADDGGIDVEEGFADRFDEGEVAVVIATVVVVEENAADAARFAAMGEPKVFVGPGLVARVPRGVEAVASLAQAGVERFRVVMGFAALLVDRRVQVGAAA